MPRRVTPVHPQDPHRELVYAAESNALADGGRRFRRFTDVVAYVDAVVTDCWWSDEFPDAPIEVDVERRSRSATFSCATVAPDRSAGLVLIRDGSWDAVTVVDELAHVATLTSQPSEADHGPGFVGALVELWRRQLGIHAYGALCSALDEREVPRRRPRRPGDAMV